MVIKRAFWLATGAAFGAGSSYYANKLAREVAAKLTPAQVTIDLTGAARAAGTAVRDALAEGRVAMREREADLRAEVEGRVLTPDLELRLRAQLIDQALSPELRAEIIRQAIPPELEAALLDQRLTPEIEQQLRREVAERRDRQVPRQLGRSTARRLHRRRIERGSTPHAIEATATDPD